MTWRTHIMNTSKLTARIVALSLATASCACRQSGALGADSPEAVPAQPAPSVPAAAEAPPAEGDDISTAQAPRRVEATVTRPAQVQLNELRATKSLQVHPKGA